MSPLFSGIRRDVMLNPFASLIVRLRSLSLSGVEGRAGSSLAVILTLRAAKGKNPFHSALRVNSAKHPL